MLDCFEFAYCVCVFLHTSSIYLQGSFFRRQNTEGLTLVGLFMEGTTLTCLETYSDAKKRTLFTYVNPLSAHGRNLSVQ
jgi:hypothetical protein